MGMCSFQYLRVFHTAEQREVFVHFVSVLPIFVSWMRLPYFQEKFLEIDFLRSRQPLVNNGFVRVGATGTFALDNITLVHQPVVRAVAAIQRCPLPRSCTQLSCWGWPTHVVLSVVLRDRIRDDCLVLRLQLAFELK